MSLKGSHLHAAASYVHLQLHPRSPSPCCWLHALSAQGLRRSCSLVKSTCVCVFPCLHVKRTQAGSRVRVRSERGVHVPQLHSKAPVCLTPVQSMNDLDLSIETPNPQMWADELLRHSLSECVCVCVVLHFICMSHLLPLHSPYSMWALYAGRAACECATLKARWGCDAHTKQKVTTEGILSSNPMSVCVVHVWLMLWGPECVYTVTSRRLVSKRKSP